MSWGRSILRRLRCEPASRNNDVREFGVSDHVQLDTGPDGVNGPRIDEGTSIWMHSYVGPGARIGARCTIGQGVHIGSKVIIGNGCKIQNGAQLFEGVELLDDVFIGPHVVFTNVLTPRAHVDRRTEFKLTRVGRGASIGANATILCGITIGQYALIGAGSVVTRDVRPHAVVYGNSARGGAWACRCGERLYHLQCPRCNAKYSFASGEIRLVEQE